MWVVPDPSLVSDGVVPAVRAGERIEAALVLQAEGRFGQREQADGGGGAINPAPADRPGWVSPRHRITGVGALRGPRAGVEAGGLFVLCEDPAPVPGADFDAAGDLHLTTWLVSRSARSAWLVRAIVLHTAPVPVGGSSAVPDAPPNPALAAPRGTRLMTAEQYVDAVGAQQAAARSVWVRGGAPDYTAGEQHRVEQAVALERDPVGTSRRYLLDVDPAPHP
ncbi:hypothetical protein [Actinocrinis sp.]|uniref:hypothetical protein n=1 Tax=Actinocrinis sp. TaxID=1920516 RepID=UPI002D351641|nr:hypothetical protein [Actinocrinis sp.]HZP52924.1 hypothetical protein [Actinocrinis sp.]